ncbi:MAG: WYL domain-containing protein [Bacteroidaceae bacterium]|nr:WYL domain-containing protein [Bacteroidaceae bacterium]
MPANKNAMTRYKILDELLSSRYHNYSLDDLTEEVCKRLSEMYPDTNGVVRRTIEKDIKYLEYEGPFLVEFERYSAPGYNRERQKSYTKQCLRYKAPGFSIFKKDLSDDEEYLLREALSLLGQFDGLPNLDALEGLRLGLGVRNNDRKIISFTKNPLERTNLIGELFTTISQKQVIELHYHKFESPNEILSVNLCPYLLKEYNRRWYVIGQTETGSKLLNFSLDRIDKVIPLQSHNYLEYEGDINEFFDDIIGVTNYDDNPVETVLFWVSDVSKDFVACKPLHDSQRQYKGKAESDFRKLYPMLAGGYFFSIQCKENYELIRDLCSFGENLIILSPNNIREKAKKRISKMQNIYESINFTNIEGVTCP